MVRITPKLIFILGLILSGCAATGPRALKSTRINYNLALQQSCNEQMLLNLVRLRYRDNPVFLEVNSISTQYSLGGSINAGASIKEAEPDSYSAGLNLSYAEKPTITYIPLQGEKFVERLFSPIPVEHLILLYHSGWNVARIFRLCVQQLNELQNAPSASGPTPEFKPEFEDFYRATQLLRFLQQKRLLDFVYRPGEPPTPGMYLDEKAQGLPETAELLRLLGLKPGRNFYPLTTDLTTKNVYSLRVETRALIGVLFYLSHGVEVPLEDEAAGKVTVTKTQEGKRFAWSSMLKDLFTVKVSPSLPYGAAVAVHYRGKWFYIDDADLESKSTFMFLNQLFALEAGKTKSVMPMLTIPIAQ